MKLLFGKNPVSAIAGYLLAGILTGQEIFKAGQTQWWVIGLAAVLAVAGRLANDCVLLGADPKTSVAGIIQFITFTALQAFKNGPVDWWLMGGSLVIAVLSRLVSDGKGGDNNSPLTKLTRQ